SKKQKRAIKGLESYPGGKFAQILLNETDIPLSYIVKAIKIQQKLGNNKILSAILIELGLISEGEERRLIRKHGREFRFGELACELGYITLDQLRQAEIAIPANPGLRMGELIIKLGFMDERQLAQALSEQLSLPLMHIDIDMIDRTVITKFSRSFMQTNLIIPFDEGTTKISVVTADPLNEHAINEIETTTGKTAVIAIAARDTITLLLNKLTKAAGAQKTEQTDQIADIVDSILLSAVRDHASDIHIEPLIDLVRIRFRLDGVLIHKMDLPVELAKRVTARIKVLAEMDIADNRRHQDGRISSEINGIDIDFRASTYVTLHGENLVLRILRRDGGLKTIEQIKMSHGVLERFKHDALDVPTGVIIVTGPTGSGKTTTLYAAIDYLNRPSTKIITVEDPVEYVIEGIMQCSVDKKAGRSFDDSLKAIVRQDPDIIVLGEVRDKNTAQVAVQAALTGHKVLTTFHTEDSIGGLLRLLDMGIDTFMISSTVVSILAQRLIRTICPDCRQAYMPNKRIASLIGLDSETMKNHTFYRGTGCGSCHGTGYHGRTTLHELLILNEPVREAIIARKSSHDIRKISCESTDLLSLMEDGLYQVLKGETTVEEVYRIAPRSVSHRSVEEIVRLMGDNL
ncbi:MAG: GspE/PulE family protein, partial [Mariprofundaceae bacterium]